ncbi:stage III sporulation protein SpoIIIAB [Clostridium sp.]|uniref:stage III sporulation protein SpoIIIAB n=1 Tax=Clostridium sp. TaxID=1506 RepID=UPI0026102AA8|nr:stage III sporulation protein SpoIIIAB [Clostridium sp.]
MLKGLSIITIVMCCSYLGFYYGEIFKKRNKQIDEILKAILFLNNEVIYNNTPLPDALKYVSLRVENPINSIISAVSDKLIIGNTESVFEAFKEEYIKDEKAFNLKEEDINIIKNFLKTLGESGVYGQDKIFNLVLENLKMNSLNAKEEAKKNIKMYRSLGFCIGAMIAIFLL